MPNHCGHLCGQAEGMRRAPLRSPGALFACALPLQILLSLTVSAKADLPSPVLDELFPLGAQAGTSVTVTVGGSHLEDLSMLRVSQRSIRVEKLDDSRFQLTVPDDVPAGVYDVAAVGKYGLSAPRLFCVSRTTELVEPEGQKEAVEVPMNSIMSGRIDAAGQIDRYRFDARAGELVVIECRAERIGSMLRGVLELFGSGGERLASSYADVSVDPRIDFRVPADGTYVVALTDLTYTGGKGHFYRLSIGTGPRIDFALPTVLQRGTATRVTLFGKNLRSRGVDSETASEHHPEGLDQVEVEIAVPADYQASYPPVRLTAAQLALDGYAFPFPGAEEPVLFRLIDVPVAEDGGTNHSPGSAQRIPFPCEVSGQLASGDEQDWFSIQAQRGEVLWFEAFGDRLGSPVDLDLVVLDETGAHELLHLTDELENIGGEAFPTTHLDPTGRWVVPADGRYLVMLRNLGGDLREDPRRVYDLAIRREEQDFQIAVVPRRAQENTGLNVWRGGRALADVIAVRRLGFSGPIRVTAEELPPGIECPEIWLGPEVNRAPLIVTALPGASVSSGSLVLVGRGELGADELVRRAKRGTSVPTRTPIPAGRLTAEVAVGLGPEAPISLTASAVRTEVPQGGLVEVQVAVERRSAVAGAPVELSLIGLPPGAHSQPAMIPEGMGDGWIGFQMPDDLAPGPYTFAVEAKTEVRLSGEEKTAVTAVSNPVTIEVYPAPFLLSVDAGAPRKIARGEVIQLNYHAQRMNGFIGKIHTELAATGELEGLRARGVTFVGGTSDGTLQIIASDDAPLGFVKFLHLDSVGTVEDEPVYHSGRFLELEITPQK